MTNWSSSRKDVFSPTDKILCPCYINLQKKNGRTCNVTNSPSGADNASGPLWAETPVAGKM